METTFLTISVFNNIVFVLYARWLIQIIRTKEEEVTVVSELVSAYVSHLSSVHEMEMFYGDETLGQLIRHSKEVVDSISKFRNLFEIENDTTNQEEETEEN